MRKGLGSLVASKVESLKAKHAKRDELLQELDSSLALEQLWPGIFDYGQAKSQRIGKGQPRRAPMSRKPIVTDDVFRVTAGNGEVREFRWDGIPDVLKG